jgi:hypothetical protein
LSTAENCSSAPAALFTGLTAAARTRTGKTWLARRQGVADGVQAGNIRSCWPFLRANWRALAACGCTCSAVHVRPA